MRLLNALWRAGGSALGVCDRGPRPALLIVGLLQLRYDDRLLRLSLLSHSIFHSSHPQAAPTCPTRGVAWRTCPSLCGTSCWARLSRWVLGLLCSVAAATPPARSCLVWIGHNVLLDTHHPPMPAPQRAYREERQRWQLVAACLEHCELTLTSLRSGEDTDAMALRLQRLLCR